MAGGKKISIHDLSIENILSKITEYDIYRFYLGDIKLGKAIHSPIRKDNHPSFSVRTSRKSGMLYHVDFADSEFTGGCFDLVKQLFGLTLREALEKVDRDFGLGITGGQAKDYKQITKSYSQPEKVTKPRHILVVTRKFTQEELRYWNQYGISESELKENGINGIEKLYLDRRRLPLKKSQLRFAYEYHTREIEYPTRWKIYTPFADDKKLKWFPNNVPIDVMDGVQNIRSAENTVITKSKKDYMVLRKFYNEVCATQNESLVSLNDENRKLIEDNSKNIYVGFDNDAPGKKASTLFTETYGYKHINVPDVYNSQGITDFSDWAKHHGIDKVIEHFRQKGLLS